MKYIITCFLLVGCAGFSTIKVADIDPEFDYYVEKYRELKKDALNKSMKKNITIYFYSLGDSTIGVCQWYSDGSREILIDPNFWYSPSTTEKDREVLMYHELGHCDLDRDHIDPSSIMEEYHIGGGEYEDHEEYYKSELFGGKHEDLTSTTVLKPSHGPKGSCGGIHREL